MKTMTPEQLWEELRSRNLVEGAMPALGTAASPWYVRVMLGVAGGISALFLLAFLGLGFSFVFKNTVAAIILGMLCCLAAYLIFRTVKEHDFGMQFGLVVSLAGQGLFLFGWGEALGPSTATFYLLVSGFELFLALLLPNFIHRVLTSAAAGVSLALALVKLGLPGLTPGLLAIGVALVWLNARCWAEQGSLWRPLGYGLALALLQSEVFHSLGSNDWARWWGGEHPSEIVAQYWISGVALTAVWVWTACRILTREGIGATSKVGLAAILASLLVGLLSFSMSGVVTSLLLLVLGFACGNRILMGLGLVALGAFATHYYYQLHQTLLVKSMVLAASGGVLLAARQILKRGFPALSNEEKGNA